MMPDCPLPAGGISRRSGLSASLCRGRLGVVSDVVDNPAESRFEIEADGHLGVLEYHRSAKRLVLIHTEVPPALEGRGIAGQLVRFAVDRAEAEGLTIVPRCPYARAWL